MSIYTGSITRAKASIAKKGAVCTWRQYDIAAGSHDWTEADATTFVDYPVSLVVLPFDNRTASYTFQQQDNDVTRFLAYALMSGEVPFVPRVRDLIIRPDGQQLKAMGIDELKPATEVILYTIGLVA